MTHDIPAAEPRTFHDVQHGEPFLAGVLIFAKFVEILELQDLVLDEVQRDLTVAITLANPDADACRLSVNACHHRDYICQYTSRRSKALAYLVDSSRQS